MDTNISVQKVDVLEEVSKEDVGSTTKQMDEPMIPLSDAELLRWVSLRLNTFVVNG